MKSPLLYLVVVLFCSGAMAAFYRLLLVRKVSFAACRRFLLLAVVLPVVLPALDIPIYPARTVVYPLPLVTAAAEEPFVASDEPVAAPAEAAGPVAAACPGVDLRRLAQLAFGRANDAARLALRPGEVDPEGLDLSAVAEIKVTDKGGVEIKLVDRVRALETLCSLLESGGGRGAEALYQALAEGCGETEEGWDNG